MKQIIITGLSPAFYQNFQSVKSVSLIQENYEALQLISFVCLPNENSPISMDNAVCIFRIKRKGAKQLPVKAQLNTFSIQYPF